MAWNYFPLSVGDIFSDEAWWQELIDAINERCTWAGIATLSSPVVGDQWVTAAKIGEIQSKIEALVPYFTNPTPVVSGTSVTFSAYSFATLTASLGMTADWYRWIGGSLLKGGAAVGDNSAAIGVGASYHFLTQFYLFLDALKWTTASGVGSNSFQYVDAEHRSYYEYEYPSGVHNSTGGLTESDWTTSGVVTPSIDEGNVKDLGTLSVFEKVGNYSAQVVETRSKIKVSDLPSGLDKKSATFHFLNSEHFYYAHDPIFATGYEFSVASFSIDNPSSSGTMTSSDYFGAPLGFSIQQGYDNIPPSGLWSESERKYVQRRLDSWSDWPSGNVSSVQTLIEINFDKLT